MNHPELDFIAYPHAPGYKRVGTSKSAADSMREKAPTLRSRIHFHMTTFDRPRGFTADEIAYELYESILSIRPRFTELLRLGKIVDTGETRANVESGKQATVWRAV
jgi:hypothetical protein